MAICFWGARSVVEKGLIVTLAVLSVRLGFLKLRRSEDVGLVVRRRDI